MKNSIVKREDGSSVIEMGLICALIALACIVSTSTVGENSDDTLRTVGQALEQNTNDFAVRSGGNPGRGEGAGRK